MNKIYPYTSNALYFDGCSKGNPGKAGIGAVLYVDEAEIWASNSYVGTKTNNEAEYMALIFGLTEAIKRDLNEIIVYGDSLLVINQMTNKFKVNSSSLLLLHNQAKQLTNKFNYIEFQHVYRNFNKRADKLANMALDNIDT